MTVCASEAFALGFFYRIDIELALIILNLHRIILLIERQVIYLLSRSSPNIAFN